MTHTPTDSCTCEPYGMDRCDYRLVVDRVIELLNPPDDDAAEVSICITAVEGIAGYVASLPCVCLPGAAEYEVDACDRCRALGRVADKPAGR